MLAPKTKWISIPFRILIHSTIYLHFGDNVMGFAVFLEQRLLKRANILHLKAAIAFHHQPYRFGLLVLPGKV